MEASEIELIAEVERDHWLFKERRQILARELRRLPVPGRALDIGAAGGGNTAVFQRYGWAVTAVDYSETAVAIARQRNLDAVHADARDLPFPAGSFDLVTAFDVLEHIVE